MVDQLKKSNAQKSIDTEAIAEMKSGSKVEQLLSHVSGVDELLKYTADRFNSMREQLAMCCALLRNQDSEAYKYTVMAKALSKGDYGLLLDQETSCPPTYDVEDATEFTKLLKNIEDTKRYDTRICLCMSVHRKLMAAIARLQEKSHKLKPLSVDSGSSENEVRMASKRIVQFSEAIGILTERDKLVCAIYRNARKQVSDFLAKMHEEFCNLNLVGGIEG